MKKLFVSVPMKNRTPEAIKNSMTQMHKIAEIEFGEELDMIQTYIEDAPPDGCKNDYAWFLGESLKRMMDADYFIGVNYNSYFEGCNVERDVAAQCKIPQIIIHIEPNIVSFFKDIIDPKFNVLKEDI